MFKVLNFKELDSTITKAKKISEHGIVVVTEKQTKGKGRFKRHWSSLRGGLYVSIVLQIKEKPQYLTFITAISMQKAIKGTLGLNTIIKWPNDLTYNKKKICGVLTETMFGRKKLAIVGVGLNSNNNIPPSLQNKASSLNKLLNRKIDNKKLLDSFLKNFEKYYLILKNKKYSKIRQDWKKNSFLGAKVRVKTLKRIFSGVAFDVDADCFLVVKDKRGKKVIVREGDVFI